MLNRFEKRYTTIFLADSLSPSSLILLKRRTDTDVAPNLYTGLGGKIELGEDQLAGAVRELKEELLAEKKGTGKVVPFIPYSPSFRSDGATFGARGGKKLSQN